MQLAWNKWTVAMTFATVFFLGSGVKFLFESKRLSEQFAFWENAKPMNIPVDFSKPGQFDADFKQTCSTSHGEVVALRLPPEVLKSTNVTQLLAGLEAKLEIQPANGTNQIDLATAELFWQNETLEGTLPLFSISPFQKGNYKAHISVTKGATALAGIPQSLEGRYLLCGLEALPAALTKIVGGSLLVLGAIFSGVTAWLLLRRRKVAVNGGKIDSMAQG